MRMDELYEFHALQHDFFMANEHSTNGIAYSGMTGDKSNPLTGV